MKIRILSDLHVEFGDCVPGAARADVVVLAGDRQFHVREGATVVVTHHLPHRRSVHPDFHQHPLNPAFVSHMPDLVRKPVALWIHGHTHCSVDYVTDGTRVVCNPRGYAPNDLNPRFDPQLVVGV